ncbi:hypothetical protein [Methylorubrum extorquens]|uniref:hypothetical protein n=1 Tax=Methylorubrum extorquens TaxID=408 RepID=UPI0020A03211|nr:hypothetical protein [Methylorubrum extorquens]MCP1539999.1 hypothetical protein [Methylorubrum extorquens]
MSGYFKITYRRKQVITDFLAGAAIKETTVWITETISGLPAMTVANYRKVLGDQIVSVEEDESFRTMLRDPHKTTVRRRGREHGSTKVIGPAAETDDPLSSTYAGLITKLAAKERAA